MLLSGPKLRRDFRAWSVPRRPGASLRSSSGHTAEALLDSLVQATGVRENFGGTPGGFTAAQLPDAEVTSEFQSLFGKPQRMEACECERDNESNMLQALHLINGQAILRRVTDGNSRVAQLLKQHATNEPLVEDLYLWSLAHRPTPQEVELAHKHFEANGMDRAGAAQDLMWGLVQQPRLRAGQ